MIKFGNYNDLPGLGSGQKFDEIWFIMRSLKSIPTIKDVQIKHMPILAPSGDLFNKYLELKSQGGWGQYIFESQYVPQFLTEFNRPEVFKLLSTLYELSKSKNILLACACPVELMCHRSIVCGILQGMYPDIEIQSQDDANYMGYYTDFLIANNPVSISGSNTNSLNQNTFVCVVSGDYHYRDYLEFNQVMDFALYQRVKDFNDILLITGNSKGPEEMAKHYANDKGYQIKNIPTDWDKDGKAAGYRHADKVYKFIYNHPKKQRGCVSFWNGQNKNVIFDIKLAEQCRSRILIFDTNNHKIIKVNEVKALLHF